MRKRGFFYLKNTLILSVLLFLFISIPPVFASQINQTLTYDGNGNLITGDGKYREYNEFNQLLRVYDGSYPNGTILESYLYHPTEDRILIKYGDYASSTPGDAVVYVNDNLEKTYDNLGGTPRTNYTYYTFDESGLVGQITKNSTNGTLRTLYYHNDYSGSVSLITNSSGNIIEQTFYDPFGAILTGGDASRYSYEGKEFSSVTEDFDFHFRKYDPSLMIFTQPDSVVANAYDPQSLNRYAFERNNPYKYVDEDGKIIGILVGLTVVLIIGIIVGIADATKNHQSFTEGYETALNSGGNALYETAGTEEGIVFFAGGMGAAGELEGIFNVGKNTPPNPNGAKGGLGHQEAIAQKESELISKGLNPIREVTISDSTVGVTRRADIVGVNKAGKITEIHQVGKSTSTGLPVSRERKALSDIKNIISRGGTAQKGGIKLTFSNKVKTFFTSYLKGGKK